MTDKKPDPDEDALITTVTMRVMALPETGMKGSILVPHGELEERRMAKSVPDGALVRVSIKLLDADNDGADGKSNS